MGRTAAVKENWKSMKQSFEVNILTFDVNYYNELSLHTARTMLWERVWVFVLMWRLTWFLLTALMWKICRNCNFILLFCFLSARNYHHRLSLEHELVVSCSFTFHFKDGSRTVLSVVTQLNSGRPCQFWLGLARPASRERKLGMMKVRWGGSF